MSDLENAFDEAVGEVVVCLNEELEEILHRHRVWMNDWVRRRDTLGASVTLFREMASEVPKEYRKILRMSIEQFELLQMVEPLITNKNTPMRNAIPARQKLEVMLRYLASGDSFQTLSLLFRIPATSIATTSSFLPETKTSSFLPEVMQAVITVLKSVLKVPSTVEEWLSIQKGFDVKWNFPNCCGAIDGKHVIIRRPPNSYAEFYNYKGSYSVILLAPLDADYRFIYIDVGTNGRANDGSVFRLSTLSASVSANKLNWPKDSVIVGDDAFPLRMDLMKLFSKRNLTLSERIFNYRLSRARRVVENAFGILALRFRVFLRPIDLDLTTVDLVIQCACTLHNWIRITSVASYLEPGSIDCDNIETGVIEPGTWRTTGSQLESIGRCNMTNNCVKKASDKREKFATYFVNEGSVPWQMKSVGAV